MKILFAADESPVTMNVLKFLTAQEGFAGRDVDLVVLNVQLPIPHGVTGMVGSKAVAEYHQDESEKVLAPIREFLADKSIKFRCEWVAGRAADEILRVAKAEKAALIVMGTRGHGSFAGAVMGSVSQRVVASCEMPVLLVK